MINIGDTVEVTSFIRDVDLCRGDHGTVIDIKDGRFLVNFTTINAVTWLEGDELVPKV